MGPERGRWGHSLVELVVALLILLALGSAAMAVLTAQLRMVRQTAVAAEAGNAVRFASRLLREELRPLVVSADVRGLGPDSSSQRVFRGLGIVCAVHGTGADVRYRGIRDPDPAKDSVIVLSAGAESAHALSAVAPPAAPACLPGPGETVMEISPGGPLATDDVLLFFESGTWYLSASALRYERGAGGRQPVTATVLVDDSTSLAADVPAHDTVALRLRLRALPAGARLLHGLLGGTFRIALLNPRLPLDSVVFRP
jgi:hypothetical protein